MLLIELFNTVVPWKWVTKPTAYVGRASFVVGDNKYIVTFEQDYQAVGVPVPGEPTTQFLCQFRQTTARKADQYSITGTGSATTVFGTVLDIINKFHQTQPQAAIRFTAEESSRVKLYNRMVEVMYPGTSITQEGRYTVYKIPPIDE